MPKKEHFRTFKNPKLFPIKQLQMEQSEKLMFPDHQYYLEDSLAEGAQERKPIVCLHPMGFLELVR